MYTFECHCVISFHVLLEEEGEYNRENRILLETHLTFLLFLSPISLVLKVHICECFCHCFACFSLELIFVVHSFLRFYLLFIVYCLQSVYDEKLTKRRYGIGYRSILIPFSFIYLILIIIIVFVFKVIIHMIRRRWWRRRQIRCGWRKEKRYRIPKNDFFSIFFCCCKFIITANRKNKDNARPRPIFGSCWNDVKAEVVCDLSRYVYNNNNNAPNYGREHGHRRRSSLLDTTLLINSQIKYKNNKFEWKIECREKQRRMDQARNTTTIHSMDNLYE